MYGFEALADAIALEGVNDIFAVVADDNMETLIELTERKKVRMISARNERGAVTMADGYARVTGKPGVCTVTQGPGLANCANSLITASRFKSPVLCITSEASPLTRQYRGKAMYARPFAEFTAGRYINVRHSQTLAEDVRLAFRYVRSGQGPVVLGVPYEIIKSELEMDWEYPAPELEDPEQQRLYPDPGTIARAVNIISTARKPVVLVGRGAYISGADDEIKVMAEKTGALIATTMMARGYLADHEYNVGMSGSLGSDTAHSLLSECDCVIAVGSSLSPETTEFGLLYADARTIQIDRNPGQIGENIPVDLGITADARACLTVLNDALAKRQYVQNQGWWNPDIRTSIAESRVITPPAYVKKSGKLDPRQVVAEIDRQMPKERTLVMDGGHYRSWVAGNVAVPAPDGFVWTSDFGSIGLGLYAAIGAAVGRPDRQTLLFVGDGGFMMSFEELETAARERIPLTIVVMNDGAYAAETHMLEMEDQPIKVSLFDNPDFSEVARALGATGLTVKDEEDLLGLDGKLTENKRPVLINAIINRDIVHPVWKDTARTHFLLRKKEAE